MRENLKINTVIKNVNASEETLMHNAERPSNYFCPTHNQAQQIKKEVIDLFHIVISLSLVARYLTRFRIISQTWGNF